MSVEHVDQAEFAFQTPRYNFGLAGGERISVRPDDPNFILLLDNAPFMKRSVDAAMREERRRPQILYNLSRARPNASTYIEFRQVADSKKMPVEAIDARTSEKRELLTEYFPHRFGKDGTQPLHRIPTVEQHKIGVIFRKVYDHAGTYMPSDESNLEENVRMYDSEHSNVQHR